MILLGIALIIIAISLAYNTAYLYSFTRKKKDIVWGVLFFCVIVGFMWLANAGILNFF